MKLGIVAIGAALANYARAKSNYNKVKDELTTLQAAVNTYNNTKYNSLLDSIEDKNNIRPEDFDVTTILRVSNLGGKIFNGRTSIVFTNTSDRDVYILNASANCFILDTPLVTVSNDGADIQQKIDVSLKNAIIIKPNETKEIQLDPFKSGLPEEQLAELNKIIIQASGGDKVNLSGDIVKADILYEWCYDLNDIINKAAYIGKPGLLRYCGIGSL